MAATHPNQACGPYYPYARTNASRSKDSHTNHARCVGLLDAIKVPQHPPLVRTVACDFLQKTRDIGRVQREQ